ncbi:VOC family protein [Sneathiella marina]|uniref:VOC family protein n=1 Tax=Sneathiella marina TaxID=2950108 RepID=A0ABY4VYQ0_9PROT|nr:VOC family protein [Sneathiella marina]USG60057.1 VOC family protein [Sneathiella marina]
MIDRLDHLVLTVANLDETKAFYCDVLEMGFEVFGEGRQALTFGRSKINLHIQGKELEPRAYLAKPGTADLCFILSGSLAAIQSRLKAASIPILQGPVSRTGATGPITSIYVRDPDLNLIELATYDR